MLVSPQGHVLLTLNLSQSHVVAARQAYWQRRFATRHVT
jgi:hypothetical protein